MYPNLPPPTYMESVWGTVTLSQGEEHVTGDWDFLPRYVTYSTYD